MSDKTNSDLRGERDCEKSQHFTGVGDSLNWHAPWEPVVLWVELPFWLMVGDCSINVECHNHIFKVDVISAFFELHAHELLDSKASCFHMGRLPARLSADMTRAIEEEQLQVLRRKCKTVLRIHSRCNSDVLAASDVDEPRRQRDAGYYLGALCEGHIPVVNQVIQSYRLATYDYFAFEVSPWDIPTWFIDTSSGFIRGPDKTHIWHGICAGETRFVHKQMEFAHGQVTNAGRVL